jgi:hypothetical protein
MRYLWSASLQLDNTRLTDLLGAEPYTALDEAVRTSRDRLRSAHLGRVAAQAVAPANPREPSGHFAGR